MPNVLYWYDLKFGPWDMGHVELTWDPVRGRMGHGTIVQFITKLPYTAAPKAPPPTSSGETPTHHFVPQFADLWDTDKVSIRFGSKVDGTRDRT